MTKEHDRPDTTASASQNEETAKPVSEFREGVVAAVPILLPAFVFGMVFGAAAIKGGFGFWQAVFASATIYAGASQFVFLELYGYKAPAWSILLAVFAVNFRHVLYSASIGRRMTEFPGWQKYLAFMFLVDPQYAVSEQRSQYRPLKRSFYYGYAIVMYINWLLATVIGASFGSLITNPEAFGLDMLLPIYFLTLVMGFRTRLNWLPVVLASGAGSLVLFLLIGPPWHITLGASFGILIAVILGKPDDSSGEPAQEHSHHA